MTQYDPVPTERKWQAKWNEWEIYRFDPQSEAPVYSIDNPPRYTSGSLHLGHATGYSMIDFAARYHRMQGYNILFPLCFDVNGTPIEVKVEKKHGISKLDTPRQEYIRLCREFANSFIDEMKHHFEILGESMDPSIYYQTDSPSYRRLTQVSFVRLLRDGLAYKGTFPVNWCPSCMTALADAEVEHRDNVTKLNYIKFYIEGTDEFVDIATTRPELLCTCQTVAVHPDSETEAHLIGKELVTPLYGRRVKVISDPKVDPEYGTGRVMICTIGDKDDLEWVMKYSLPLEKGIDEMGKMTELAGKYEGMTVLEARQATIDDLREQGLLLKQEEVPQSVSICWRCHSPVEFLQVPQWFVRILDFKDQVMAKADEIDWFPEFMKIRLADWVNSLEWDWVVSRQRIFATPIPVWECTSCGHVVPAKEEDCYVDPTVDDPPVEVCPQCGGVLKGCEDVFDTWMDSSVSSLYNTFWERDDAMFQRLFPMSLRGQSHDIIRTWTFYSILRELQLTGQRPWDHVMIHGFIMSPDGTPMHSSLGNVIDPIPILEEYGADPLRYYATTCSIGVDHAFREKDVKRGKKLCNKLYNMGRFVGSKVKERPQPVPLELPDAWILSRYSRVVAQVTDACDNYLFDKAMREVENFAWHEFADHYLEMVKHRVYEDDPAVIYTMYTVLLGIVKMVAPFMPHITEEVYQTAFAAHEGEVSVHVTAWPSAEMVDEESERKGEFLKDVISAIRGWKASNRIALNKELERIEVIGEDASFLLGSERDIIETIKAKELHIVGEADLRESVVAIKPNLSKLGPRFKGQAKEIVQRLQELDPEVVASAIAMGEFEMGLSDGTSVQLDSEYMEAVKKLTLDGREVETLQVGNLLVAIQAS